MLSAVGQGELLPAHPRLHCVPPKQLRLGSRSVHARCACATCCVWCPVLSTAFLQCTYTTASCPPVAHQGPLMFALATSPTPLACTSGILHLTSRLCLLPLPNSLAHPRPLAVASGQPGAGADAAPRTRPPRAPDTPKRRRRMSFNFDVGQAPPKDIVQDLDGSIDGGLPGAVCLSWGEATRASLVVHAPLISVAITALLLFLCTQLCPSCLRHQASPTPSHRRHHPLPPPPPALAWRVGQGVLAPAPALVAPRAVPREAARWERHPWVWPL